METKKKVEGFWNIKPKITKIDINNTNIIVYMQDGRIITAPLLNFPSIKRLTPEQRKHWYLFGNGFSFDDCNEVFHIEQILGN
jgi:hypothetical protein